MSNWVEKIRRAGLITAGCILFGFSGGTEAMSELADSELSVITARGIAFNLEGLTITGDLSMTYVGEGGQSLQLGGIALSRTDDPGALFSDPYRLDIYSRGESLPDAIQLYTPLNTGNKQGWSFAADLSIFDGSTTYDGGALLIDSMQTHGNSLTLTAPDAVTSRTIMFGSALDFDIDALAIRPRGRDSDARELRLEGVHVGGRDGGRWEISNVENQPAVVQVASDGSLQLELAWPRNKVAPIGSITIDNVDVYGLLDPGSLALLPGGLRVGIALDRVQMQYLKVRFKP